MWPGCGGTGSQGSVSAARRVGWSGPDGEEFALDKSASAGAKAPAELLTAVVGGTSRRNVLGAIASKRTSATSRSEATTTDSEPDDQTTVRAQESPRPARPGKTDVRPALPLRSHPEGSRFCLTNSFRKDTSTGGAGGAGGAIWRFGAKPEWKKAASCRPIRCWPLGRRSGCFAAEPYPPPRSEVL